MGFCHSATASPLMCCLFSSFFLFFGAGGHLKQLWSCVCCWSGLCCNCDLLLCLDNSSLPWCCWTPFDSWGWQGVFDWWSSGSDSSEQHNKGLCSKYGAHGTKTLRFAVVNSNLNFPRHFMSHASPTSVSLLSYKYCMQYCSWALKFLPFTDFRGLSLHCSIIALLAWTSCVWMLTVDLISRFCHLTSCLQRGFPQCIWILSPICKFPCLQRRQNYLVDCASQVHHCAVVAVNCKPQVLCIEE